MREPLAALTAKRSTNMRPLCGHKKVLSLSGSVKYDLFGGCRNALTLEARWTEPAPVIPVTCVFLNLCSTIISLREGKGQ
jgi:hypothetical protein